MMTRETMPIDGWSKVPVGTEISKDLYDGMLNVLPPISLYAKYSPYSGFQVGEAYTHEQDEQGRWRSMHMTFVTVGGRYYYAGINFCGRCDWRLTA